MKTRYWIFLLAVLLITSIGLSIPLLFPEGNASHAQILSNGQLLHTVDLSKDQIFTIETPEGGTNIVTISGGKIGVTEANCPDHYCMDRGMCSSGVQIVCLPNKLIIRFVDNLSIDAVVG